MSLFRKASVLFNKRDRSQSPLPPYTPPAVPPLGPANGLHAAPAVPGHLPAPPPPHPYPGPQPYRGYHQPGAVLLPVIEDVVGYANQDGRQAHPQPGYNLPGQPRNGTRPQRQPIDNPSGQAPNGQGYRPPHFPSPQRPNPAPPVRPQPPVELPGRAPSQMRPQMRPQVHPPQTVTNQIRPGDVGHCTALLRRVYRIEIELWAEKSSRGPKGMEEEKQEKRQQADALFADVYYTVDSWMRMGPGAWPEEEWKAVVAVSDIARFLYARRHGTV